MLPEQPRAMGPRIADREAWDAFDRRNPDAAFAAQADAILKTAPPALPDDLFLLFKTKGTRRDYEDPFDLRRRRLRVLVMAECLTNQGRYLAGIERELETILGEKTWVLPAHDPNLDNFNGKIVDVDLGVVVRGLTVATTYDWLGGKLSEPLRQRMLETLQTRVLRPYLKRLRHEDERLCWWLSRSNNWNAVCHAGVVGTALAVLPSRLERAEFVAGAEACLPSYLSGLTADGYCDEGLGYWNYGFGHYVILAETLLSATGGKVNLYNAETVRRTSTFPSRIELQPGIYPAFGDCASGMKPATWVLNISGYRLSGRLPELDVAVDTANNPIGVTLYEMAVAGFTEFPTTSVQRVGSQPARRDWFPEPGVLICRPAQASSNGFSVAIKGGRNAGSHYHRDLGEFLIAVDGQMACVDPGLETYGKASAKFDSDMNNSFGHSVPIVADKGQISGPEAQAKLLEAVFSPERDTLTFDLSSAYDEPALQKLTRHYAYTRSGRGSLEVADRVAFTEPRNFGGALLTYGQVRIVSDTVALVTQGGKSVRVAFAASGALHLSVETVRTINKVAPTRLRAVLEKPAAAAEIEYTLRPETAPPSAF